VRRLIVNADDLGRIAGINRAIHGAPPASLEARSALEVSGIGSTSYHEL
jgi:hypothetical protein